MSHMEGKVMLFCPHCGSELALSAGQKCSQCGLNIFDPPPDPKEIDSLDDVPDTLGDMSQMTRTKPTKPLPDPSIDLLG